MLQASERMIVEQWRGNRGGGLAGAEPLQLFWLGGGLVMYLNPC